MNHRIRTGVAAAGGLALGGCVLVAATGCGSVATTAGYHAAQARHGTQAVAFTRF